MKSNPNRLTLATKSSVLDAAKMMVLEVKRVWRHHFGIRLVDGQEYKESEVTTEHIIITEDKNIVKKITELFQKWKYLEQLSRRPDRTGGMQEEGD